MSEEHEGATPREQVLEASRRDNTELLQKVIDDIYLKFNSSDVREEKVAELLNESVDGIGSTCLHLAASYGSYDVMDLILDQSGVEVDPLDRMEKDTPLHKAVRFINELKISEWENGKVFVDLLVDAGADPRIRNKAKLKPIELVDPRNTELKKFLQRAEFSIAMGTSDAVSDDDDNDKAHDSASDDE